MISLSSENVIQIVGLFIVILGGYNTIIVQSVLKRFEKLDAQFTIQQSEQTKIMVELAHINGKIETVKALRQVQAGFQDMQHHQGS
jgi:high-affinity nickel permease